MLKKVGKYGIMSKHTNAKKPQVLAYLWFHIYQVHNGVLKQWNSKVMEF